MDWLSTLSTNGLFHQKFCCLLVFFFLAYFLVNKIDIESCVIEHVNLLIKENIFGSFMLLALCFFLHTKRNYNYKLNLEQRQVVSL